MRKVAKKTYIAKLTEIYKNIPEAKKKKAAELIGRLADVLLMMDECREKLSEEGCVTEMPQGDYSIQRENPYSKIYDAKHKLMLSTIDKLDKMLPEEKGAKDELELFLDDDAP